MLFTKRQITTTHGKKKKENLQGIPNTRSEKEEDRGRCWVLAKRNAFGSGFKRGQVEGSQIGPQVLQQVVPQTLKALLIAITLG